MMASTRHFSVPADAMLSSSRNEDDVRRPSCMSDTRHDGHATRRTRDTTGMRHDGHATRQQTTTIGVTAAALRRDDHRRTTLTVRNHFSFLLRRKTARFRKSFPP